MIAALDHIVLICPDIEAGIADYEVLLGAPPAWRARMEGAATAIFALDNMALELMAPEGDSELARKLREMTTEGGRLTTLAYRTDQIDECHRVLARRGLDPSDISHGESTHCESGETRSWRRFRIPDTKMAGIKSFIMELDSSELKRKSGQDSAVTALDHVVIQTPNADRTVATYGARLGLRFALDRTAEQWNTRFLFFRLGDLTIETVQSLNDSHDPGAPDTFGGLTWTVDDISAAHARLQAAGRNISEIRTGRKPGTQVFTVRDGTQGVPTLFITHAPR